MINIERKKTNNHKLWLLYLISSREDFIIFDPRMYLSWFSHGVAPLVFMNMYVSIMANPYTYLSWFRHGITPLVFMMGHYDGLKGSSTKLQ